MVNYSQGKVYKIEPIQGGEIYVGSTTKKYLSERMSEHRSNYKKWKAGIQGKCMSFDIFDKYRLENCQIILLESVNANSKEELHVREAHWIKSLECVNKVIPGRTQKEYREDNKDQIAEYQKEYQKQYHLDHKEQIKEQRKYINK